MSERLKFSFCLRISVVDCQCYILPSCLVVGAIPPSESVNSSDIRFLGPYLRCPQGVLISSYALCHLTHAKQRPGGRKVLFHEYAAKLINPPRKIPLSSRNTSISTGSRTLEAQGGRMLSPLGSPMSASAWQKERVRDLEGYLEFFGIMLNIFFVICSSESLLTD